LDANYLYRAVTFWNSSTTITHTIAMSGSDKLYWGSSQNVSSVPLRPGERVTFFMFTAPNGIICAINNRPGSQIYTTNAYYSANTALSTNVPFDDTIPTNAEGDQILSVAYTPRDAASTLRIKVKIRGGHSSSGQSLTATLFKDGGARESCCRSNLANSTVVCFDLEHTMTAGSTASTTFTVRVGTSSGSAYMNGDSSGRKLGGTLACQLIIEEITLNYGG
jgi:hypothetical protein